MPSITVCISDRAEKFLRAKIRRKQGIGMMISELIVAEEVRELMSQGPARHGSDPGKPGKPGEAHALSVE